jgi:hypothetical protein
VRDATIALLLLHPELAEHLRATVQPGEDTTADQLAVLVLAAAYLQRRWRTRLALALDRIEPQQDLPALHWREWNLPNPDGPPPDSPERGLRALAVRERLRRGLPLNYLAAWEQQVDHLANQAWRARRGGGGTLPTPEPTCEPAYPRPQETNTRDFIPLPAGWCERSVYVGRYPPLDVFHFDLYSMALSKIERDFQDVATLVRGRWLDPPSSTPRSMRSCRGSRRRAWAAWIRPSSRSTIAICARCSA